MLPGEKEYAPMRVTAIDYILTVTPDDLPSGELAPWTRAVLIAAAVVRKQASRRPQDITAILSELGWVIQSVSEHSVKLIGVRDAISTPRAELFDSLLDMLESGVPAEAASLLDWWWANAFTAAREPIACIAVFGISGDEAVVDMRSVSLPVPTWSWLARMPSVQVSTVRSQMILNRAVYKQIAAAIEQKASGLADLGRTVTVVSSR